jgi:hypothetical protein
VIRVFVQTGSAGIQTASDLSSRKAGTLGMFTSMHEPWDATAQRDIGFRC